jgi:multisubunit Na+/H+ antiporter MnhB subunit
MNTLIALIAAFAILVIARTAHAAYQKTPAQERTQKFPETSAGDIYIVYGLLGLMVAGAFLFDVLTPMFIEN